MQALTLRIDAYGNEANRSGVPDPTDSAELSNGILADLETAKNHGLWMAFAELCDRCGKL